MFDVPLAFHFLRPGWLMVLPVAAGLFWAHRRRTDARKRYEGRIDAHLLDHLVISGGQGSRLTPAHVFFTLLALAGLALSGPTWKRVPPPFADDQAALVIVIDASTSMNAVDVQPTRLERARQKVADLLALRGGAKTALVAFAGSAHVVLPLTSDRGILELYASSIQSDVLPIDGKRPALALAEAQQLLERGGTPGSIVFVTDGVPKGDRSAFVRHTGAPVQMLAIGTERGGPIKSGKRKFLTDESGGRVTARLDRASLDRLADSADVSMHYFTADDADVRSVAADAQRHFADVQAADGSLKWKDMGYLLLFPLLVLGAFLFRRGFSVRWAAALLLALNVLFPQVARADESKIADWFLTPDQQGRRHFERGEYDAAAQHFEDPMWRGTALYAAKQYDEAIDAFAIIDSADSWFNQGNAYARLGKLEAALAAFDKTLAHAPDHADAAHNRSVVAAAWQREQEQEDEEPASGGSTLEADDYVIDEEKNKKKRPEGEEMMFGGQMDQRMADMWMRQVQTRPADFLRNKFAFQARDAKEEDDE